MNSIGICSSWDYFDKLDQNRPYLFLPYAVSTYGAVSYRMSRKTDMGDCRSSRSRPEEFAVTVTMSSPGDEPWSGAVGRIDARLLAAVPGIATHRAHICGPPPMMDAVKAALTELGMAEANIKTEAFSRSNATLRAGVPIKRDRWQSVLSGFRHDGGGGGR